MKYEIRKDKLCYGSRILGGAECIFVEATQKDVRAFVEGSDAKGVVVCHLDVGDYVFATVAGKTVALEEKRSGDFASSFAEGRRRGRRQLRECRGAADIAGIALRGHHVWSNEGHWIYDIVDDDEAMIDLVKWQVLGGLVVMLPAAPEEVVDRLKALRTVLQPGNHLYSIVSGTDKKLPHVGQPEPVLAFRRMVKGVGKILGDALWEVAKDKEDPLGWMVCCEDEELMEVKGIHRGILAQRKKVRGL